MSSPTTLEVELKVINKIQREDALVPVQTNTDKEMWVHPDLINEEGLEIVKRKLPPIPAKKAKKQVAESPPQKKEIKAPIQLQA